MGTRFDAVIRPRGLRGRRSHLWSLHDTRSPTSAAQLGDAHGRSTPRPPEREPTIAVTDSYSAPIAEFEFLFRDVFDVSRVLDASPSKLTLNDVFDVLREAGRFAEEVLAPTNRIGDRVGLTLTGDQVQTPPEIRDAYTAFAKSGWVGLRLPANVGGGGAPHFLTNAADEFWAAANLAFAIGPALTMGAASTIRELGSEDLISTYVPPLVEGRWGGTMNLTEPQAGTDLGSIRTTARVDTDDVWKISGQKIYITWGEHDLTENIVHLVLARTEGAPDGLAGLSLFVVPKYLPTSDGRPGTRNGVSCIGLEHKLGIHVSPTCTMSYEDATGFLLGRPNQGVAAMFVMMNHARSRIAMQAIGVSDRATQRASRYAAQRVQGSVLGREPGTPIAEHPDVRRTLLSMSSSVLGMRAFAVRMGIWADEAELDEDRTVDARRWVEFFIPIFKSWCSEEAQRITSEGVQTHGGVGFIEEAGAAQHLRDVRILPIYEGTTAIQANDLVGRKVMRDAGATAFAAVAMIRRDLALLRELPGGPAMRLLSGLESTLAAIERSTSILASRPGGSRDAYAVATPYQEMWGAAAVGWMYALMIGASQGSARAADVRTKADAFTLLRLSRVSDLEHIVAVGEIG